MMTSPNRRSAVAKLARNSTGGIVTLEAAASAFAVDPKTASRRLQSLVRSGWLSRVRRGVYTVRPLDSASDAPLAEEDPWVVAMQIFDPCYIGGWSAASHWNLTEQLFRKTMVVTERHVRRRDMTVGSSAFHLAQNRSLNTKRLDLVWRGRSRVRVSSVERTIVDGCGHPEWLGGGRQLTEIFKAAIEVPSFTPEKLLAGEHTARTGAALGRLAVLVERYWPDARSVLEYARASRGSGYVRFDPAIKSKGRLNTRWGIWLNSSFRAVDS